MTTSTCKKSLECISLQILIFQNNQTLKSRDYTSPPPPSLKTLSYRGGGAGMFELFFAKIRKKGWTYMYVEQFHPLVACFWAPGWALFGGCCNPSFGELGLSLTRIRWLVCFRYRHFKHILHHALQMFNIWEMLHIFSFYLKRLGTVRILWSWMWFGQRNLRN